MPGCRRYARRLSPSSAKFPGTSFNLKLNVPKNGSPRRRRVRQRHQLRLEGEFRAKLVGSRIICCAEQAAQSDFSLFDKLAELGHQGLDAWREPV
jgi:hypothetical protein